MGNTAPSSADDLGTTVPDPDAPAPPDEDGGQDDGDEGEDGGADTGDLVGAAGEFA